MRYIKSFWFLSHLPFLAPGQVIVTGLQTPESVTIAAAGRVLVSNIGRELAPVAKDGDGWIAELLPLHQNKWKVQRFSSRSVSLNAPKGLATLDDIVYVADIDRIVGLRLGTGELAREVAVNGAQMLNDILVIGKDSLLATDTFDDCVYLVQPQSGTIRKLPSKLHAANGLTLDAVNGIIYASGMGPKLDGSGKLYRATIRELSNGFVPVIHAPQGIFDGIAVLPNGNLLISDWLSLVPKAACFGSLALLAVRLPQFCQASQARQTLL